MARMQNTQSTVPSGETGAMRWLAARDAFALQQGLARSIVSNQDGESAAAT
ncbi:MAG: hypothetical protein M5R42_12100 [Rhodocyclaceae bacterium]|nr:hypothetical protein [Rhodocyclaceae bacterium]